MISPIPGFPLTVYALETMPQGSNATYTAKQKRQASHIEKTYEKKGVSPKKAEARAWATVNKIDGGGKKSRSTSKSKST